MREANPRPAANQQPFWRRHRRMLWFGGGLLGLLAVVSVGAAITLHNLAPFLRALIVDRLAEHFHARVELDSFQVSLVHGLRAEGRGLRIWPPAQLAGLELQEGSGQVRPLIDLREFRFRVPLHYALGQPIHIRAITLDGLHIDVPTQRHWDSAAAWTTALPFPLPRAVDRLRFRIDSVLCKHAHLVIEDPNPAKPPFQLRIRTVQVAPLNPAGKMKFEAVLTNPKPRGRITTRGSFGPWMAQHPGRTPLEGSYRLDHADLSSFKGIAGILNSTGHYRGTLRDIAVQGKASTPAFSLTRFGTAVPLRASFHARVDGANGDTWFGPVRATLGSSQFTLTGKVVHVMRHSTRHSASTRSLGREIALSIYVPQGQISDFLRLASRDGKPPVTGTLRIDSTFELTPGKRPVRDRMRMRGNFALDDALFTSRKLQDRLGDLSLRGQGKPHQAKTAAASRVRSDLKGKFTIASGDLEFPDLEYRVPGANIRMRGEYDLDGDSLAFRGAARLQATLSHAVGGWKGWLLKPIDPFFRKNGAGALLHVHIDGTRADPHFDIGF